MYFLNIAKVLHRCCVFANNFEMSATGKSGNAQVLPRWRYLFPWAPSLQPTRHGESHPFCILQHRPRNIGDNRHYLRLRIVMRLITMCLRRYMFNFFTSWQPRAGLYTLVAGLPRNTWRLERLQEMSLVL